MLSRLHPQRCQVVICSSVIGPGRPAAGSVWTSGTCVIEVCASRGGDGVASGAHFRPDEHFLARSARRNGHLEYCPVNTGCVIVSKTLASTPQRVNRSFAHPSIDRMLPCEPVSRRAHWTLLGRVFPFRQICARSSGDSASTIGNRRDDGSLRQCGGDKSVNDNGA